jgi:Calx-beta domain
VKTGSTIAWNFDSTETDFLTPPTLEISYTGSANALATSAATLPEIEGMLTLTVSRTGDPTGDASVDFSTYDGSATAGADYTAVAGTLSWADGDATSRTIQIPILGDDLVEADETFAVRLTHPLGSAVLEAIDTTRVTLSETPFHRWLTAKFGADANSAIAAANADPDADGLSNFVEWALNGDPTIPDSSVRPIVGGTDYATLSFRRNASATDTRFTVEASGDLKNWSAGSTYYGAASTPTNEVTTEVSHSAGDTETIVVRDNIPVATGVPRFLRLRITHD